MTEPIIRHYGPRAYSDHPPFSYPEYKSTVKRSPSHDLLKIVATLSESTGPGPAWSEISEEDADLTTNATGEPAIGERIIVTGHVLDENGIGVPGTVLEIWQANSAGRYAHWRETSFPAPMDPNFIGIGQCLTDAKGGYRFITVKPGAYPWGNHPNAWRPAHIHLSVLGPAQGQRLVTQLYFQGDPLLDLDPIYQSAPEHSRERMVASYAHDVTEENFALGWRFDLVLRGELSTLEEVEGG
jgi:protocatechuate 3,4-dioxygenase, beta subunit